MNQISERQWIHHLLPIFLLVFLIGYGLVIKPLFLNQNPIPLELIFLTAGAGAICHQLWLGTPWKTIETSIMAKLSQAVPAFLILILIGGVIGSWMVSGTIPMLVTYGLKLIHPNLLYVSAFALASVFSLCTGTSWGSAASIGVVFMGIGQAQQADLGILAGAIIGGAYLGDKLSPLSDTTNMAAIACEVSLFDHVKSMFYTTIPSAILAMLVFLVMGFVSPGQISVLVNEPFLAELEKCFDYNIFLLLPPILVLLCSLKKVPILLTLCISIFSAAILAVIFQSFSSTQILTSIHKGFHLDMVNPNGSWLEVSEVLLNRGGLYALSEAITIAFFVFLFVGTIDVQGTMPKLVKKIFAGSQKDRPTIHATLASAAMVNGLTSNQYATSFIVGDAFRNQYDQLEMDRSVLSRSIEDTGTLIETLIPWSPSTVFMVGTLGVSYGDYVGWQVFSWINIVLAPILAIVGWGIIRSKHDKD